MDYSFNNKVNKVVDVQNGTEVSGICLDAPTNAFEVENIFCDSISYGYHPGDDNSYLKDVLSVGTLTVYRL